MKISTRGTYALEVMVDLAMHSDTENMESIRSIAERRKLSEKYLERIVGMLKRAGLVFSSRGAYGGYCLAKPPAEIYVMDILTAVEGDLAPVECLTNSVECGVDCETCPTRDTWNYMWKLIKDVAKNTNIEHILHLAVDK